MTWSPWLRLADKNWFYIEQKMWHPVCYELALGPSSAEDAELELVYLGTAAHEDELFAALEAKECTFSPQLTAALAGGKTLYYRLQARPERPAVEAICQARLDEHGPYPWRDDG
jgi:hypothetical protein